MKNHNNEFWKELDNLVLRTKITIDRPKGTAHPKYPKYIYPVDYGYLEGTKSMDGHGIDIWVGTNIKKEIDSILCIVDGLKKDSEIKILYGCTDKEKELIYKIQNNNMMKAIIVNRHE